MILKLQVCVFKKAVAINKWLNGITEAVRGIKNYHNKQENSSTHQSAFRACCVYTCSSANYSNSNFQLVNYKVL